MQLAMFVDAYICSTMVRAPYDPDDHRYQSPRKLKLTRWEEVIDYFLNHPYKDRKVTQLRVRRVHGRLSGVHRHPQTTQLPAHPGTPLPPQSQHSSGVSAQRRLPWGYQRFDWKVIADANFPTWGLDEEQTRYVVNKILSTPGVQHPLSGSGYTVRDGVNFAFKTGTPVRIPFQRIRIQVLEVEYEPRIWWREVLDLDDRRKMRELFETWMTDKEHVPFSISFEPGEHKFDGETKEGQQELAELLRTRVEQGEALRKRREDEERKVRMRSSLIQCVTDSVKRRAIH